MSKTTKRKHVTKEVLDDYYVPEGSEQIVKVIGGRGNNLHEVEGVDGSKFLASMPNKFRKNVWIKRGDFVVITPITEGNKVQAEIVYVLYNKQMKYLQQEGLWPAQFENDNGKHNKQVQPSRENGESNKENSTDNGDNEDNDDDDDDDNDEMLMENPNRPKFVYYSEDETSSDDSVDKSYDEAAEK